jgi:hypothetical protein
LRRNTSKPRVSDNPVFLGPLPARSSGSVGFDADCSARIILDMRHCRIAAVTAIEALRDGWRRLRRSAKAFHLFRP